MHERTQDEPWWIGRDVTSGCILAAADHGLQQCRLLMDV